jgi:hypothetical protein
VVVHDDSVHTYRDCIQMLQYVFGYDQDVAYRVTREIDRQGRAVVWSGSLDVAERKCQQAREFRPLWRMTRSPSAAHSFTPSISPLRVTIEPAARPDRRRLHVGSVKTERRSMGPVAPAH